MPKYSIRGPLDPCRKFQKSSDDWLDYPDEHHDNLHRNVRTETLNRSVP